MRIIKRLIIAIGSAVAVPAAIFGVLGLLVLCERLHEGLGDEIAMGLAVAVPIAACIGLGITVYRELAAADKEQG